MGNATDEPLCASNSTKARHIGSLKRQPHNTELLGNTFVRLF